MMNLCSDVLKALDGKTLVTAESLTGGGIGAAMTAVPGASTVFKGGVISYCDEIKHQILGVSRATLTQYGAVSFQTAQEMAVGVRKLMNADIAVSVTGLAGPGGDEFGHEVGTVFIGYSSVTCTTAREYHFSGDREAVRTQTIRTALELILQFEA